MARPRTTHTAEFKLSAVKMITDQKLSVAAAVASMSARPCCARGARPSRRVATRPSRGTATGHPPRTNSDGSAPRSRGSRPSGTC